MNIKEKIKKIPVWLYVVIVLVVGGGIALTVFLVGQRAIEIENNPAVTFLNEDGSTINVIHVEKIGGCVTPPTFEYEGIFRGWSASLNDVEEDREVVADIFPIDSTVKNFFYYESQYVKEGDDATIELNLDGDVELKSAQISMYYDPEVLDYKNYSGKYISSITEDTEGELVIQISSDDTLTEKAILGEIKFATKIADAYSTDLPISCTEAYATDEKNNIVDNATINNKIYFLKEGE